MKTIIVFVCVLFAIPAFASPLDYGKEAEIATKEAYASYRKGDLKTLQFALERLTVSCNMIALEGSSLPSECERWFSVLKEGCSAVSQKNALRECAQKFYQGRNKRPHASSPVPQREVRVVATRDKRGNFFSILSNTYRDTLISLGRTYSRNTSLKPSLLSKKIHAEWAKFLNVYNYYTESALVAFSRGDRQGAYDLLSQLKYYVEEKGGRWS
ncbi:hypothetical protein MYX76_09575 [Desulfobacterota bacterium AH_259_B03_O07]|nr:hypothetical protein [Desulfobacterota bacterium AH_259_B03_O07]